MIVAQSVKRILLLAAAGGTSLLCLYLGLAILTPTFGRVIGYADEQPRLQILARHPPTPPEDLARTLRLAKLHFDSHPGWAAWYWPEPAVIEERPDCWLVTFKSRVPVYSLGGFTQALRPTDAGMFLSIDKADGRTRAGKWCL